MKSFFKKSFLIGTAGASMLTVSSVLIQNNSEVNAETTDGSVNIDSSSPLTENSQIGPGFYGAGSSINVEAPQMARFFSSRAVSATQTFIDQVAPGALSGWNKYGILPSVSIAQAILESGWGKSQLSKDAFNLFGIKGAYQGQSILMPTQEYVSGQWITVNAQFRRYPDWSASIEDHGFFLASNSRYSNLWGKTDYKTVTSLLQQDGYATAPNYADVLNQLIEQYSLTQYDQQINNASIGYIDNQWVSGNTLTISGWHAISASNYPYSFIMLTDRQTGEKKKYSINRLARTDVQKVYPYVANSLNSGFQISVPITEDMYGHSYAVTSLYATNSDGSGVSVGYDFTNTVSIPTPKEENKASLDNFYGRDNKIYASGWHASNEAAGRDYRFLIVMDSETNKEITRMRVSDVNRADVAAKYPGLYGASKSGFNSPFEITQSMVGKNIYLISRYSKDFHGNSDYVDYDFKNQSISVPERTENKASLDNISIAGTALNVHGWHATDLARKRPYHYLFLMDAETNKEIKRISISNFVRTDVSSTYPNIFNANYSGYHAAFLIDRSLYGKKVYLKSRYSADSFGSRDYVDYDFNQQVIEVPSRKENKASLDVLRQNGNSLVMQGWHASDLSSGRSNRFLIIMNAKTNKEITRTRINALQRNDVANVYPNLYGADKSGFLTNVAITSDLSGKQIYLISRYSSDFHGNSDYVDYNFSSQKLNVK